MSTRTRGGGALAAWRMLLLAQVREQPRRLLATVLAIALGVALGAAVYLVDSAALGEFGRAARRLVGEADLVVRGPGAGFSEDWYVRWAHDPAVALASPMLQLQVAVAGRHEPLEVLGVDPFIAVTLQPQLLADLGGGMQDLLRTDGIYLSHSAAADLRLGRGDRLPILVGGAVRQLRVLGVLAPSTYPQPLGLMDIAAAQQALDRLGRLNRVDLRLADGQDAQALRAVLSRELPAGTAIITQDGELDRARNLTRAYRVNLNMLAMVALWTGAFLVYSTQALAVLRRRRSLALLRALGVTRGALTLALSAEGAAVGACGSLLGVLGALALAAVMLRLPLGELGGGSPQAAVAPLDPSPWALLGFWLTGTLVCALGAWLAARAASRLDPAPSLKGGDIEPAAATTAGVRRALLLLAAGAGLSLLPAVHDLPLFGYAGVAALLFGAVLLVPALMVRALRALPRTGRVVIDVATAQLRENVGLSTLSLASIIVSFSLMVAMLIMVYSFRDSFDHWLGKLLPADLQLREPLGNETAFLTPDDQGRLAAVPGVARAQFRRTLPLRLDAAHPPVTLIARGADAAEVMASLPMVRTPKTALPAGAAPVWISEAVQDLYGYTPGQRIDLPLAGRRLPFVVAGVWRDYARTAGAVVLTRPAYLAASGDGGATEGSLWLDGSRPVAVVADALRAATASGAGLELLTSGAVRERSLQIFDRAFAVTYVLEAVAVLIGLTGIGFAASSTALARRAEFGMLRHVGMRRRQVVGMLVSEAMLTSLLGVAYGLALGAGLSLVLIYVVNRESFHWSIDLAVPGWQLLALGALLIGAGAVTAIFSGRAALGEEAVHAVREDW